MHVLMMILYAAIAATVLAVVDPRTDTIPERLRHGLKMFGAFLGIGLLLSWILFPIPW
jgi:mannose/fructose/N-acetylgalactosamine-specific phosphotransferase system component IIC